MRLCAFACSLYLTGIVLSWFSSLAPNSIQFWNQLECELHGHFFNMHNKGKLSDLTSVKQGRDESVLDYFQRFKAIKNRCFNLTISEKGLADLAYNGFLFEGKTRSL